MVLVNDENEEPFDKQPTKYPLNAFWITTAASTSRSMPQLHGRTCDSSPAAMAVTEGLRPPSATLCLGFAKLHRLFSTGGGGGPSARPPPAHAALCSLRSLSPSFLVPVSTFLSHLIARPMAYVVVLLAAQERADALEKEEKQASKKDAGNGNQRGYKEAVARRYSAGTR